MSSWFLVVIAAPFAIALAVALVRQPTRLALPVFAAAVPFGDRLGLPGSKYADLSTMVGLLLGVGLVLQLLAGRRSAQRMSLSVPVWLLFMGLAGATVTWSIDRTASVIGLGALAALVLVYVCTSMTRIDRDVLRRTENGLLVGGVAVVCYGLVQLFLLGGFPTDSIGNPGRFGNDLLGPNIEAVSLLLPMTVSLHRAVNERGARTKCVHAAVAMVVLLGVMMTGSRGGMLATGVAVLVLAVSGPVRARKRLLVAFALAAVAASAVWIYHPADIASRSYASIDSSSGRTSVWQVGLAACSQYCTHGSGWETFADVYADTQASVPGAQVLVGSGAYQAHNVWLLALIELGVTGAVLLTAGLAVAFVEGLRLPRLRRGPPLSALAGMLIAVFFLSSLEFKCFWMVLLMVALNRNLSADDESQPADQPAVTTQPVAHPIGSVGSAH